MAIIDSLRKVISQIDQEELSKEVLDCARDLVKEVEAHLKAPIEKDAAVSLLPVRALREKKKFWIPGYQRGYRWEKRQVVELLEDLWEFFNLKDLGPEEYYCLQPIVACFREDKGYEVIDGQQRLTTLFIIIQALAEADEDKAYYEISYETREGRDNQIGSWKFLKDLYKIDDKKPLSQEILNVPDFYYIAKARLAALTWISERLPTADKRRAFLNGLKDKARVIWYVADGEKPIDVFTRLNIGKVGLTGAELIKAMLLKCGRSNAEDKEYDRKIQEMATEWDTIEHRLQDDVFWMFLNNPTEQDTTRLDFLFDLLVSLDGLNLKIDKKCLGPNDGLQSYRYITQGFVCAVGNKVGADYDCAWRKYACEVWKKVRSYHDALEEWYEDLRLFHYIGFLTSCGDKNTSLIGKLLREWTSDENRDKLKFYKFLEGMIDEKIFTGTGEERSVDLQRVYLKDGKDSKTECRPFLLFHNVMTIVQQNDVLKSEHRYQLPAFTRFPFHLYKRETWDVEHIASSTDNALDDPSAQKEWLICQQALVPKDLKEEISGFLLAMKKNNGNGFKELYDKVLAAVKADDETVEKLEGDAKWQIGNFALLDSHTNRSYGNALFPTKRNLVLARCRGVKLRLNVAKAGLDEEPLPGAFVPPCTKNVFTKAYTSKPDVRFLEWDAADAKYYVGDMKQILEFYKNTRVKEDGV